MDTEHSVTLKQNTAACIHSAAHWGETVYHNICSGTTYTMPWGSVDYWLIGGATAFLIGLGLFVIVAVIGVIYEAI